MAALTNGRLPDSILVSAAGSAGARLRRGTAGRWAWVREQVHARHGWWPEISGPADGYRPLDVQIATLQARYDHIWRPGTVASGVVRDWAGQRWYRRPGQATAATPGQSNHGWGSTVDVTGLGGFGGQRYAELAAVAAEAGFSNAAGRSIGEPWHWEDQHDPDTVTLTPAAVVGGAAVITTLPPTSEEDDMLIVRTGAPGIYLLEGGLLLPLRTQAQVDQLTEQGVKVLDIPADQLGLWQGVGLGMVMLSAPTQGVALITAGSVSSVPTPADRDGLTARGVPLVSVSDELLRRLFV